MKVVINRCFGGFSLSDKAIEMIMRRKGFECFRYKQIKFSFIDGIDIYKRCHSFDDDSGLFSYYSVKDFGETISKFPGECLWSYYNLERTDKDLIAVVEELGMDANGQCGELKIIDIPDDVEFEIDDYDGMETIHEVHRCWC